MLRQFINFLRRYVGGEEITIEREYTFTWWEVAAILVIIGLIIRWIWL